MKRGNAIGLAILGVIAIGLLACVGSVKKYHDQVPVLTAKDVKEARPGNSFTIEDLVDVKCKGEVTYEYGFKGGKDYCTVEEDNVLSIVDDQKTSSGTLWFYINAMGPVAEGDSAEFYLDIFNPISEQNSRKVDVEGAHLRLYNEFEDQGDGVYTSTASGNKKSIYVRYVQNVSDMDAMEEVIKKYLYDAYDTTTVKVEDGSEYTSQDIKLSSGKTARKITIKYVTPEGDMVMGVVYAFCEGDLHMFLEDTNPVPAYAEFEMEEIANTVTY